MIDIILYGCQGKMGHAVAEATQKSGEQTILYGIDRNKGGDHSFPVYDLLSDCPDGGQVIIDFSSHDAVSDVLDFAKGRSLPLVIASTGLTQEEMEKIKTTSTTIPIFQAPNFSIGINLLAACIELILPVLEKDFDVEIIDKHHKEKKDSPSGTALQLADVAKSASKVEKRIGISALRAGTIPGEHTVIFAGPDEIVELKHTALSRDIFAQGAIKAATFLVGQPPGLYNMKDLIINEL
jgi:4-hydroxy-tetrahydrodipicolinate reductase